MQPNAQLQAQKHLFMNKLTAETKKEGGIGGERSQFPMKSKYDEILECLREWDSISSAKERKEKWGQAHAWRAKYQVFGTGDDAVLIFNPEFLGRKNKEAKQDAAPTEVGTTPASLVMQPPAAIDASLLVSLILTGSLKISTSCTSLAGIVRRGLSSNA